MPDKKDSVDAFLEMLQSSTEAIGNSLANVMSSVPRGSYSVTTSYSDVNRELNRSLAGKNEVDLGVTDRLKSNFEDASRAADRLADKLRNTSGMFDSLDIGALGRLMNTAFSPIPRAEGLQAPAWVYQMSPLAGLLQMRRGFVEGLRPETKITPEQASYYGEFFQAGEKLKSQLSTPDASALRKVMYETGKPLLDMSNQIGRLMQLQFTRARVASAMEETGAPAPLISEVTRSFDTQISSKLESLTSSTNQVLSRYLSAFTTVGTRRSLVFDMQGAFFTGGTGYLKESKYISASAMGRMIQELQQDLTTLNKIQVYPKLQQDAAMSVRTSTFASLVDALTSIPTKQLPETVQRPFQTTVESEKQYREIDRTLKQREAELQRVARQRSALEQRIQDREMLGGDASGLRKQKEQLDAMYNNLAEEVQSMRTKAVNAQRRFSENLTRTFEELAKADLSGLPEQQRKMLENVRELAQRSLHRADIIEGRAPMSPIERVTYSVLEPAKQLGGQFLGMNMQNLQMALMFGFSSSVFQALTQIPMESTYRTVQPVFQAAGSLTGLSPIYQELTGFAYQAPAIMSDLQARINSMQALLGSRYYAESSVGKALEIARVQPIQFPEAMEILTAMAVYPSTKNRATDQGFQEKIFNAVQLLSMLAPEQGVGGALFAVREMLGGQFRSLQMRFNISPEVLAAYAGKSVSEFKGAPGAEKVEILAKALETMFGGGEILYRKGAQFDVQLRNIGDTLTSAVILPMVRDIRPAFAGMVESLLATTPSYRNPITGEFIQSGRAERFEESTFFKIMPEAQTQMLTQLATQRTASQLGIDYRAGMNLEQVIARATENGISRGVVKERYQENLRTIAVQTYGTGAGMLSMIATALNTALSPIVESLNIGGGLADIIGGFNQTFSMRVGGFREQIAAVESGAGTEEEKTQMKRNLARDLVQGFVEDLNRAVNEVKSQFSSGPAKELLRPLTELMRDISMTTFQPVAEVMMTQTAKTAVALPGMLIGGTISGITRDLFTGGSGGRGSTLVDFMQGMAGAGAWMSMARAREAPWRAGAGVAGFSLLQAGIESTRNESYGTGLLQSLAGLGGILMSFNYLPERLRSSLSGMWSRALAGRAPRLELGAGARGLLSALRGSPSLGPFGMRGLGSINLLAGLGTLGSVLLFERANRESGNPERMKWGSWLAGLQSAGVLASGVGYGMLATGVGAPVGAALEIGGLIAQVVGALGQAFVSLMPSKAEQEQRKAAETMTTAQDWARYRRELVKQPVTETLEFTTKQLSQAEKEFNLKGVFGERGWEQYSNLVKQFRVEGFKTAGESYAKLEQYFRTGDIGARIEEAIINTGKFRTEEGRAAEFGRRLYQAETIYKQAIMPEVQKAVTDKKYGRTEAGEFTQEFRDKLAEGVKQMFARMGITPEKGEVNKRVEQLLDDIRRSSERNVQLQERVQHTYREMIQPRVARRAAIDTLYRQGYEAPTDINPELFQPGKEMELKERMGQMIANMGSMNVATRNTVFNQFTTAAAWGILSPQEAIGAQKMFGELTYRQLKTGMLSPDVLFQNPQSFNQYMTALMMAGRSEEAKPYIRQALLSKAATQFSDMTKANEIAEKRGLRMDFTGTEEIGKAFADASSKISQGGDEIYNALVSVVDKINQMLGLEREGKKETEPGAARGIVRDETGRIIAATGEGPQINPPESAEENAKKAYVYNRDEGKYYRVVQGKYGLDLAELSPEEQAEQRRLGYGEEAYLAGGFRQGVTGIYMTPDEFKGVVSGQVGLPSAVDLGPLPSTVSEPTGPTEETGISAQEVMKSAIDLITAVPPETAPKFVLPPPEYYDQDSHSTKVVEIGTLNVRQSNSQNTSLH